MSSDPVINSALMRMCAQARTAVQPSSPNDNNNNNNTGSGDGEQRDVILAHDVPQTTRATTTTPAAAAAAPAAVPATRQPEDYAWLRSALAAVEAPERRVKTLLERAEQPARGHDDLVATLEELSDLVEDINWATEFALMHGPRRLVRVLRTSPHAAAHAHVRAAAALVMAHSAQLSDALQSRYAEAQWCEVLLPQLRVEDDAACVAALLHACSCLCRGHAGNTAAFVQHGGLDVLAALLRQRLPRLDTAPPQQQQEDGDSRDHNNSNNNTSSLSSSAAAAADNKVIARALFFLRYFAEAGVSSEELIELACQHAEGSLDDVVQRAAAGALLQLLHKSPRTVAATMRRVMVTRLRAWRVLRDKCQRRRGRGRGGGGQRHGSDNNSSAAATTGGADDANSDDDDDDARVQLMAALDRTA